MVTAMPAPPGSPQDIPGLELAGEVAALGPGAERFSEGDRVMAIVGGGGQAELAVVHERALVPVPESVDWPEAGGIPELGEPLDPAKRYKVASNNFMLSGGDGYTALGRGKALIGATDGKLMANEVMAYIRRLGTVEAKVEGRLVIR